MRELFKSLLLSVLLCSPAGMVRGEPVEKPYQVYVGNAGASVFSGPGDDYYVTQQLPAGTECEVYEELRDGWLAIRPPEGSYSLVLRSALGPVDGDVARVTRDGTPSRVGSVLVDKNSSVHVRLDEGERVQVIEIGSDSQWATVAPPAGEFRWIRGRDIYLTRPSPEDEVVARASDAALVEAVDASSDWRQRPDDADQLADEPVVRNVSHDELASNDAPATESLPAKATPPLPESASFASSMNQLEVDLSRRVTGPVNLWVFDDLQQRAAKLLSAAATPVEEQQVDDLAERMARFGNIAKRYQAADQGGGNRPTIADTDATTDAIASSFDAVGVLRPVVSKHGNAPPYALVGDSGKIVTFITPSPSLNLQQHLGQRVGVSGTRGYLPEFRNRNIQTARVAPLDQPVRR